MVEGNEEAMETKVVNLYTLGDAQRDMSPHEYKGKIIEGVSGIDASVRKWESIVRGLSQLQDVAETCCGLCIEHPPPAHCEGCPLESDENYMCCEEFDLASGRMDDALFRARAMLERLRKVKEEQL